MEYYRGQIIHHQKCWVIYKYRWGRVDCDNEYIGEILKNIWRKIQGKSQGWILYKIILTPQAMEQLLITSV